MLLLHLISLFVDLHVEGLETDELLILDRKMNLHTLRLPWDKESVHPDHNQKIFQTKKIVHNKKVMGLLINHLPAIRKDSNRIVTKAVYKNLAISEGQATKNAASFYFDNNTKYMIKTDP